MAVFFINFAAFCMPNDNVIVMSSYIYATGIKINTIIHHINTGSTEEHDIPFTYEMYGYNDLANLELIICNLCVFPEHTSKRSEVGRTGEWKLKSPMPPRPMLMLGNMKPVSLIPKISLPHVAFYVGLLTKVHFLTRMELSIGVYILYGF